MRIFFGLICFIIGGLLCITVIGAVIGIPLIAVGIWLIYGWYTKRLQSAITKGIIGASRESAQAKNQANVSEKNEKK